VIESVIKEFLFEVNEFPEFGKDSNIFTVKDYFFYDSQTAVYGHRNLIVPVSKLKNPQDLPSEDVINDLIQKKIPILKKTFDFRNKSEIWSYDDSLL
jgi:hypothetical protein